jgi:hypothetical protein
MNISLARIYCFVLCVRIISRLAMMMIPLMIVYRESGLTGYLYVSVYQL